MAHRHQALAAVMLVMFPYYSVAHDSKAEAQELAAARVSAAEARNLPTESVFKIFCKGSSRDYVLPWQVQSQAKWSGSGFAVSDRLIMTNAHVVENSKFLQVAKQDDSERHDGHVVSIAHDIDLALITIDADGFWEGVRPVNFTDHFPKLYSDVKAIGYPIGGETVSVTKGVVSRIDARLYAHPRHSGIVGGATQDTGKVLIIQIDAAINSGNSGGPAFSDEGVCGVASSSMGDGIGYIIPSVIAVNYLEEHANGGWRGLPETGIRCRPLVNRALRHFLMPPALAEGHGGVQVHSISPLSPLHDLLKIGDVLLEIDGNNISKTGNAQFEISSGVTVQLAADAYVTKKKPGATTQFRVLRRSGEVETVSAALHPLPALAPRFDGVDARPSYVLVGGLVFTRMTTPLEAQLDRKLHSNSYGDWIPVSQAVHNEAFYRWRRNRDEGTGVIVLLRMLAHKVNDGYDEQASSIRVLRTVNGKQIDSLAALVDSVCAARRSGERFLYMTLSNSHRETPCATPDDPHDDPDVVLDTAALAAADAQIMEENKIPAAVSEDLDAGCFAAPSTTEAGGEL